MYFVYKNMTELTGSAITQLEKKTTDDRSLALLRKTEPHQYSLQTERIHEE